MVTFKQYTSIQEVVAAAVPSAPTSGGQVVQNHNGIRRMPLSAALQSTISRALNGTGLNWKSHSGGQPASGANRVGSHRHDNGNASDGDFVDAATGKTLNADAPADKQKIAAALARLKSAGIQGVGWDSSATGRGHYMGSSRFHLDVSGPAGVWGSSTRGDTAAAWVVNALGGVPQGEVQGDAASEDPNMPPGAAPTPDTDYDDVASAAQGLAQGMQTAFGGGMMQ